jgi:hypothetical protein
MRSVCLARESAYVCILSRRRDDGADAQKVNLQSYIAGHHTLMLAYARAGEPRA